MRFTKWLTFLPALLFMVVSVHGQDVHDNYDRGTNFAADTVTLKNGQVIEGTYLGGSPRGVKIETGNQIQTLDVADILRIEFDAARERRELETSPAAGAIELPAGTNLVIRMIDGVDSERNSVGQTFAASLDEPVVINGETVIPRGADVVVKLVDATESGKLTGRTTLTVDLMSLKVNGRMVDVNTETVTEQSSSRGARTAKVAGGTAALGTIIGAIAGGGKGAAIGLGAGAAAGAGAEILTKGQRVKIPSETRLTFVLENAIRL
ncbi:MAG TPA: hypothetical protein VKM93_03535 [Terriglobia bacterium]|nr:hypothetical protein [Terriglobia bacterium]